MNCCSNKIKSQIYEGTIHNKKRDGYGVLYDKDNNIKYKGDWKNDKKHGKGIQYFESGTYSGLFINGLRHGNGKYEWRNGDIYEGKFKEGHFTGKASFVNNLTKDKYVGGFLHFKKTGHGEIFNDDNLLIFSGEWLNNMKNGYGISYEDNEVIKEGYWINDKYSHEKTNVSDDDLCNVCYLNDKTHAFLPCGHLCICDKCIVKYDSKICIICQQASTNTQKIFK